MIVRAHGQSYWNFVVGVIVLTFVFYVTTNGQLPKWLALLSFTPAPAPKVGNVTVGATPGQPGVNLTNPTAGMPSSIGQFFSQGWPSSITNGVGQIGSWAKSLGL